MDISVFKAVCRELAVLLPGARLSEATEGGAGELCITIKTKGGGKLHLLMSPRPDSPRLYLTSSRSCRSKALSPTAQAIMNRVIGATVLSVEQEGMERAVTFRLERKTRREVEKAALVYEMAGKKPNIIVLDGDGRVVTAQTYVPLSDEALRPVLPGMAYMAPPAPDKQDPHGITAEQVASIISDNPGVPIDKLLFGHIGGLSPLLAREAVALAGAGADAGRLKAALDTVMEMVSRPAAPRVVHTPKGPLLAAFPLSQFEGSEADEYDTMSEAADAFYGLITERRRFTESRDALIKDARKKLSAARKKRAALESDRARAGDAGTWTHYGNLLMASLSDVPERTESVRLKDLFSEDGGTVDIPLDPRLSAVKNAERYFGMARKANTGLVVITNRLADVDKEITRLESALQDMESATGMDGLGTPGERTPKPEGATRKTGKTREASPEFPGFTSSDGFEVVFGKNARANDLLTFKHAEPMDMWLHAQGYHGAHVIVRNPHRRPDIPLNTILEAAGAAAWFSNARKDSSVAVDYTFRKYVRKPRDPVPGQATFTRNKTVFVEPKRPPEK